MRRSTTNGGGNRRVYSGARTRRRFVLSVRARRHTAARARVRLATKWFWLLMFWGTFAAAMAIGTQTALEKFFFANPDYNLARVRLENCPVLDAEEARLLAGLRDGGNLFRIDLRVAEKALERIPEVVKATVRRELPDTISISLDVREPLAWVVGEDEDPHAGPHRLVDASGFLYTPRKVLPDYSNLPRIVGAKLDPDSEDRLLHREDVRQAILLLQTNRFSPGSTLEIKTVDVSKGWCLVVRDHAGTEIIFEADNYTPQLQRLQKLLDHCKQTGRRLEMVNLVPKRNTPVRFVMADAPRPASETSPPRR